MKLYLIRHAPVAGKSGFIYGDDAAVDWAGQEAALCSLASALPAPEIADWYASGVDRANKSGMAVLERMGVSKGATMLMQEHQGFREQDFGDLVNQSHDAARAHVQFINNKIYSPRPPNGESIAELILRVARAIDDVRERAERNCKQQVVVFCHGGTIRAAHIAIRRLDINDYIALDTPPLSMHGYDI